MKSAKRSLVSFLIFSSTVVFSLLFLFDFICADASAATFSAQDPDNPDTVRLANVSGELGEAVSMPIFLYNDEELSKVVIPLLINGYSGWLRFDSVSYVGSRLADPTILDYRETYLFGTDTFSVDSVLLSFSVSSGNNLPADTGKLCELWFTLQFGGEVLVESLTDSPQGNLSLTDSSQQSFTPRFLSASIDISCNYIVGDLSFDNDLSITDMITLTKQYHYDYPPSSYPIYDYYGRADVNCDRRLDLRDLTYLAGYLFRAGPPPCTCGTINSSIYDDPDLPDSVWVENKTMIAGFPSPICIGVVNDEPLSGIALSFDTDGNALLEWDSDSGMMPAERIQYLDWFWGVNEHADSVNPENFHFYGWEMGTPLPAGNEAVCCPFFIAQSAGTVTFNLTSWINGNPSMLVTEDNAAILPAFYGGNITILPYLSGDANHDGEVGVSDVVYLINYIFKSGPPPEPLEAGDANCDDVVDIIDIVYLVNYLFRSGPPPQTCEY
jgi:hypothetical protein